MTSTDLTPWSECTSLTSRPQEGNKMTTMTEPVGEGDLFESSWGYDQTNIDYYKVVRATAKSAWIVPIGQKTVAGSEGFMCEQVLPDPDTVLCDRCHSGPGNRDHNPDTAGRGWEGESRYHEYVVTPSRHAIRTLSDQPSLKVRSFAYAYRVTGDKSSYQSHYA